MTDVADVPDAPTRLKISDIKSERNIVLSWEPGSDHNSSITGKSLKGIKGKM